MEHAYMEQQIAQQQAMQMQYMQQVAEQQMQHHLQQQIVVQQRAEEERAAKLAAQQAAQEAAMRAKHEAEEAAKRAAEEVAALQAAQEAAQRAAEQASLNAKREQEDALSAQLQELLRATDDLQATQDDLGKTAAAGGGKGFGVRPVSYGPAGAARPSSAPGVLAGKSIRPVAGGLHGATARKPGSSQAGPNAPADGSKTSGGAGKGVGDDVRASPYGSTGAKPQKAPAALSLQPGGTCLFIGGLPSNATEDNLRCLFGRESIRLGKVTVCYDWDTGECKGYAFADLTDPSQCERAMRAVDKIEADGCKLTVRFYAPPLQRLSAGPPPSKAKPIGSMGCGGSCKGGMWPKGGGMGYDGMSYGGKGCGGMGMGW